MRFDWRWLGLIAIVIVIAGGRQLPWPIVAVAFGIGGGYLLRYGWRVWAGRPSGRGGRIVYWRGQRIQLSEPRRASLPVLRSIMPAIIPLLLGGILALAAVSVVLRGVGL
jgi:hypothetical protein